MRLHVSDRDPAVGVLFNLQLIDFDAYGRVRLGDHEAVKSLQRLFGQADALACRSGCGAPLSCDTALITEKEMLRIGPEILVNNADFANIIRKRKAVNAHETVIVFESYKAL